MTVFAARLSLLKRLAIVVSLLAGAVFFGRDVFASALVARADAHLSRSETTSALRFAQRARVFDPTFPDAAQRIGLIAIRSRRRDVLVDATGIGRAAIERAPHDTDLRIVYSQLLFALKDYRGSALSWNALAQDRPESGLYAGWAAEAARFADACDLALPFYARLVRRNPRDVRSARLLRGFTQRQEKKQCSTS